MASAAMGTLSMASAAMQARIMERVKRLPPLANDRIALSVDEAIRKLNLLACSCDGGAQFNHVMRGGDSNADADGGESLMMGTDFEVVSKDQWFLLVKYFSEHRRIVTPRPNSGMAGGGPPTTVAAGAGCYQIIPPVPLVRSYELIGLGIRTQIEYFMQQVSITIINLSDSL